MAIVTGGMRLALNVVSVLHGIVGTRVMSGASGFLRKVSGNRIPVWNPYMPKGADPVPREGGAGEGPAVVYFPTCINRSMGGTRGDPDPRSVMTVIVDLLHKAGYRVVYPENLPDLCCGMAFASKGFKSQGDRKAKELETALRKASRNGELPILVDMSPCLYRMKEVFSPGLRLFEPVQFILDHVLDRLEVHKLPNTIAIHTTCSAEKMGLAAGLKRLAGECAERVIVPHAVGCCGWAGDRGFTVPELNASALAKLPAQIPPECTEGYSTSRTCEIGLSLHGGIPYRSIAYLLDRVSGRREGNPQSPS